MNSREEILAKSRDENKDKDLFEREVQVRAGNIGACVATLLATLFFVVQILVGAGMNYGLYAILFSVPATRYIVKSINMRCKRDIAYAIIWTVAALIFSLAHIYGLITSSTIL